MIFLIQEIIKQLSINLSNLMLSAVTLDFLATQALADQHIALNKAFSHDAESFIDTWLYNNSVQYLCSQ